MHQLRQVTILSPVLTYGLTESIDVALGLNHVHRRTTEESSTIQDARGADGLSVALKPGVTLPTGDENRGLGTGKSSRGLAFILTREAKPWVWSVNAAFTRVRYELQADANANHEHLKRFSAGFTYALRDDWRLAGELGVRKSVSRAEIDWAFVAGATFRW